MDREDEIKNQRILFLEAGMHDTMRLMAALCQEVRANCSRETQRRLLT